MTLSLGNGAKQGGQKRGERRVEKCKMIRRKRILRSPQSTDSNEREKKKTENKYAFLPSGKSNKHDPLEQRGVVDQVGEIPRDGTS